MVILLVMPTSFSTTHNILDEINVVVQSTVSWDIWVSWQASKKKNQTSKELCSPLLRRSFLYFKFNLIVNFIFNLTFECDSLWTIGISKGQCLWVPNTTLHLIKYLEMYILFCSLVHLQFYHSSFCIFFSLFWCNLFLSFLSFMINGVLQNPLAPPFKLSSIHYRNSIVFDFSFLNLHHHQLNEMTKMPLRVYNYNLGFSSPTPYDWGLFRLCSPHVASLLQILELCVLGSIALVSDCFPLVLVTVPNRPPWVIFCFNYVSRSYPCFGSHKVQYWSTILQFWI